jgi:methyl-accepting chemotaxis protein
MLSNILGRMTISKKLYLAFGFFLLMLVLVSVGGVLSARNIGEQVTVIKEQSYQESLETINLANLATTVLMNIVNATESATMTPLKKAQAEKLLFHELLSKLNSRDLTEQQRSQLENFNETFQKSFVLGEKMVIAAVDQELMELVAARKEYKVAVTQLNQLSEELKIAATKSFNLSLEAISEQAAQRSNTGLYAALVVLVLGLGMAIAMSRHISVPLVRAAHLIDEIEKGHYDKRLNMHNRHDEIGAMAKSMDALAENFENVLLKVLYRLAAGDLNFNPVPRDDRDGTRIALKRVSDNLNQTISQILGVSERIAAGSGQVAGSSQSLSQGATEQASSLEEISASLNQMAAQTTANAENAKKTQKLTALSQTAAQKGRAQMQAMVSAMGEINEAGQSIFKIIKVIDEIAFQTNLLALNAAVEAARAGQHGKGFAVVAEEVRNLAARSAKAAAETTALIEGSIGKTENGSSIANQTADALQEIVSGIDDVTGLIGEMTSASTEQAQGIAEINQGVSQIDQVTQQNTAIAEECAASAEELSGQAEQLQQILHHFILRDEFMVAQSAPPRPVAMPGSPPTATSTNWAQMGNPQATSSASVAQIALDAGEFGKY